VGPQLKREVFLHDLMKMFSLGRFGLSLGCSVLGLVLLSGRVCDAADDEGAKAAVQAQEPITFAGIWMAGPEQDWARRFPVGKDLAMTRRVYSKESEESFELAKSLLGYLRKFQQENPGGDRIVDALASPSFVPKAASGSALVMACVLNHEYCFSRKIGKVTQNFAEVSFDLVICDFSNLTVVASFPYRIERIGGPADKGEDMLRDIYTKAEVDRPGSTWGQQDPVFINEFPNNDPTKRPTKARPATLREGFLNIAKCKVKALGFEKAAVRKVTVMDPANEVLHEYFKPFSEAYFANMFSSNFFEGTTLRVKDRNVTDKMKRRYEYAGTGVACLPFSKGNEVVYSMLVDELADAFRVKVRGLGESESKNVQFSLGRPLYEIDLVVPAFQTVPTPGGVKYCAYSRIEVKIDEQTLYSRQHDANEVGFASGKTQWESYADAANSMFFEAGDQILRAVNGPDVAKEKPLQVVKPSPLRKFFLLCAPDCAKSFNKK